MHEVRLFILIVLLILFLIVIFLLIFLFFWRLVVAMLPSVLFTLQSKVDGTLVGNFGVRNFGVSSFSFAPNVADTEYSPK